MKDKQANALRRVIRLTGAKRRTNSPDGGEVQESNPILSFNPA